MTDQEKINKFEEIQKALWITAEGRCGISGVSPSEAMNIIQQLSIPDISINIESESLEVDDDKGLLWQLHWQFKDGHTVFCAQISCSLISTPIELRNWIAEIKISYPLPKDAVWLMCNENDPNFKFIKCPAEKEQNEK